MTVCVKVLLWKVVKITPTPVRLKKKTDKKKCISDFTSLGDLPTGVVLF